MFVGFLEINRGWENSPSLGIICVKQFTDYAFSSVVAWVKRRVNGAQLSLPFSFMSF